MHTKDQEKEFARPHRRPWAPRDVWAEFQGRFVVYALLVAAIALVILGVEWFFSLVPW